MTAWEDYTDAILGDEPDYEEDPDSLPPEDREAVNRSLGRLAHVRREMAVDANIAETQIGQIRTWRDRRLETHRTAERWHEDQLARYHEAVLRVDGRAKTISLPFGRLEARAGQPNVTVDETFTVWAASERPELVRVKVEPDRTAIRQAVVKEGEALPGVTVTPTDITFRARTNERTDQ